MTEPAPSSDASPQEPTGSEAAGKPTGREAVERALVESTIELMAVQQMQVSVRDIAEHAGVNHGLVHAYFGSKNGLVRAAADHVNAEAAAMLRPDGFPPADLINRAGGLLAKAITHLRPEADLESDPFTSHPVTSAWIESLKRREPDLSSDEIAEIVAVAASLSLGWAQFGDHLCSILGVDGEQRASLDKLVYEVVSDLGHIPADMVEPDDR